MKRFLIVTAVFAAALSAPASAQVSVSIGQPGFYGHIDIGGFPPPLLIHPEPLVIHPGRMAQSPIYLRVPPRHAKHWHRYCDRYRACGRPVYFVQDDWYQHEYAPRYRERHAHRHDHRDYRERHEYRHERREDRHDRREHRHERRHDDHDNGHGRGRD